jgi:mycothiol synthase
MELEMRPPAAEDAPAVAAVVNACTTADVGMAAYTTDDLLSRWEQSERYEVAVAPGGEIVGYLETEPDPGKRELYYEGVVRPDRRGRGVGMALIASAERRAAALGRASTIVSNVSNGAAAALMLAHGYERTHHEYAMFLDLDRAFTVEWPDGIDLRPFVEGRDEELMHRTMLAGFGDDWPSDRALEPWMTIHQSAPTYDPELWFFATVRDEAVGAVQGRRHWGAQEDTGFLKNIAVVPQWRRSGVGRALLMHVAELFRRRDKARMVLGTYADNPTRATDFYIRMGMYIGGESFDYTKRPQE